MNARTEIANLELTLNALELARPVHLTILDAALLVQSHHPHFPPDVPTLITSVVSSAMAAEVKQRLMTVYPGDHQVRLVHASDSANVSIQEIGMSDMDGGDQFSVQTSLYVPPLAENTSFEGFQELVAHLRAPEGCPWDREQTHQTLRPNLLEETYETLSAIDTDDAAAMQEEFGDLLLQVVLHAQIASEYGEFKMADVIKGIHTKLVDRHPHVFGDVKIADAEGVKQNWERLKAHERQAKGERDVGVLDGIPVDLPALAQADAYQKRAARVGFDWPEIEGVLDKISEEVEELRQARDRDSQVEEIGDLFFALANLARWKKIDPESALRATNKKFRQRFAYIEANAREQGRELESMTLKEMDVLWERAKKF